VSATIGVAAYFLGRYVEALRWSENACMNGRRIFFKNQSYKVIMLPAPVANRDY
jgi:hypothetical protein